MLHKTALSVIIALMIGDLSAQTIQGIVYGKTGEQKAPLFEAAIQSSSEEVKSDSLGLFSIDVSGDQELTISCDGYEKETHEIGEKTDEPEIVLKLKDETAGKEAKYEVFGMGCPGCHGGLENHLDKLPQVKSASANWQKDKVSLTLYPCMTLPEEDFQEAVEKANMTPGESISE